jgi:threonyl-tRNA synthetase
MNLPERFDCSYVDSDGNKKRPIMLHRACLGSIERFIGILIEHYAGAFPTWMAPVQVNLLPVNNDYHLEYTNKLLSLLKEEEIRVEKDDANEKLGYRLRNSVMRKIPYTVVIGDNEVNNNLVTYRKYGSQEQITVSYDEFLSLLKTNIKNKGR